MKTAILVLLFILTQWIPAQAGIKRISGGGVSINISELLPEPQPAVLVFFTVWDKTSIALLNDLTKWSESQPDILIFFVDVVDERTGVYRQFSLTKIPTMIVMGKNQKQIEGPLYDLESLKDLLKRNTLLQ